MVESTAPIILPDPLLSDGVITLRPWAQADVPALVEMCNDPQSVRFTTVPTPYTATDAEDWLTTHAINLAAGESASFAIVEQLTEPPIASIGLHLLTSTAVTGAAEVGYMTAPPARGRGVMTRAVQLVCEWAFQRLAIERVQLTTHLDNPASQRVAAKCGFTREGVLRRYGVQRGERVDLVMFSRLASDPGGDQR